VILRIEVPDETTLVVNSPAFPGWRAWIDGREEPLARDPASGYLAIRVPPALHRVRLAFTDTPVRRAANTATAASIVACLALFAAAAGRGWAFGAGRGHRGRARVEMPSHLGQ
jgi:hypothetical protein